LISKSDVKYIQSLAHKKFREEEGLFVVEGVKMVEELLIEYPEKIVHLYGTQSWFAGLSQFRTSQCPVSVIDDKMLNRISQLKTPNEVLALVKIPQQMDIGAVKNGVTVVLDQLQDPGNLGTIIRTADWFGIKQVICSPNSTELYNPKTLQASMGAVLRVNVSTLSFKDLSKKINHTPIYGAVLNGENIYTSSLSNGLIIIGNEANGISEEVLAQITHPITIPAANSNGSESLNAANACAIICSEFHRQLTYK
jgi:TrmH family RNA methyltransferase